MRRAADLDWSAAYFEDDLSQDYGELRVKAISWLDGILYSVVFTQRDDTLRIISLRKADKPEQQQYADHY